MKKVLIAMVLMVCLSGCGDISLFGSVADKVNENSDTAISVGSAAVDAVENISGKDLIDNDTATTGAGVADTVEDVASKVETGAGLLKNLLPEDKQIYAEGISYAAYLAGALAGVAAGVFKSQKDKAEIVTASVITGADGLAGAGKAIVMQAKLDGVSTEVEKAYLSAVKNGDIELN